MSTQTWFEFLSRLINQSIDKMSLRALQDSDQMIGLKIFPALKTSIRILRPV